jgi:hypothetical protein
MRLRTTHLILPALLLFSTVAEADTILRQRNVADLNKAGSTSVFPRYNTEFHGVDYDVHGLPVVNLQFNGMSASFGQKLGSASDWSPYAYVTAKMTNKESRTVRFKFIVLLTSDPNNYNNAYTASFELKPNETQRFMFHLNNEDPEPYGMEYLRPVLSAPYRRVISGSTFRNLKTIYHWRISHQETSSSRVTVTDLRLIKQDMNFDRMVDTWGQYTDRNWDGKVDSDKDFAFRKTKELTYFDANADVAQFLGTTKVISETPATGSWETVMQNGKRYLQHPNGRLFWSLGVSGVHDGVATIVEGRENYFTNLPSQTGTFAAAYSEKNGELAFSHHQRNLMVKYGSNYANEWAWFVKNRMASWGFNTLGIQSAEIFHDGTIPYTEIVYTKEFPTQLRVPRQLWGPIPDPYTSGFRDWMIDHFKEELAPHVGKQAFMGVFVDNELSWGNSKDFQSYYNVPRGILNAPSNQPSKINWRNSLQSKYSTISSLNKAWGTSFSSWDDFLNKRWLPTNFTSAMHSDFKSCIYNYAARYFKEVDSALAWAGLKSLYLGSRFCDYSPQVVSAAAQFCDVVSFNFYRTADRIDWDYLGSIPKPVMFSEFSFGAFYNGTFGGPAEVVSDAERESELYEFLKKAAQTPNIVGALWYCYTDQPITGRYTDGENAALGLVDVTDNPHWETVEGFRNFAKNLYTIRG